MDVQIQKYTIVSKEKMFMWRDGESITFDISPFNFLSTGIQNGNIVVWLAVQTDMPKERVAITTFGTGAVVDTNRYTYWGTVQKGTLVYHIFQDFD